MPSVDFFSKQSFSVSESASIKWGEEKFGKIIILKKVIRRGGLDKLKWGQPIIQRGEYRSRRALLRMLETSGIFTEYKATVDLGLLHDGLRLTLYHEEESIDLQFWLARERIMYDFRKRGLPKRKHEFTFDQSYIDYYFGKRGELEDIIDPKPLAQKNKDFLIYGFHKS